MSDVGRRAKCIAVVLTLGLVVALPGVAMADLSFSGPTSYGVGTRPVSVAAGDFNRDGDPDLAVANSESDRVTVRLGGARGTFGAGSDYFMGDRPESVAVGDLNGDSNPDLVTANLASDNVTVRLGDGAGSFGAGASFAAGDGPISIAVGQFNRDEDSHLDVVVSEWGSSSFTMDHVNVLLGNGDGTLRARSQYEVGMNLRTVTVGDINGDDDPDLAVTSDLQGIAGVLPGQAGGSFGQYSWTPAGWGPRGVTVADFNGDGRGDMAVTNTHASDVSMMLGPTTGDTWGFFAWPVESYGTGNGPTGVVAADFDGDSRLDIATANNDGHNVSVLLGDGAGSVGAPINFATGRRPNSIAVADFNGDSEPDMAVSNWESNDVSVLLNNDPPAAADDHYATEEDVALRAAVLGNDTDPDGDTLTATVRSGPAHGSVQSNADGSLTYTPDPNFHGSDSFTYSAGDGSPDPATATVTIDVRSVADVPVTNGDDYETDEDTALTIGVPGVIGNDSDGDGDALTAAPDSGPDHGTLTLNANGSFRYDPAANYNGPDSFTYRAGDGGPRSDPATVTLTVNPANDPPDADQDTFATDEDTPLTVAAPGVLGNDRDIDGDSLTALAVTDPAHGRLELGGNGSLTYTPDADYHGQDGFTYQAKDGSISVPAQVLIDVRSVNDAPRPNADEYATDEDTRLRIDAAAGVLGNDTDPDGDTLTAELVSQPAHGSLTLNGDGSFSYTPAPDYNGTDSFTYRASDASLESDVATVAIEVRPVDDPAPPAAPALVPAADTAPPTGLAGSTEQAIGQLRLASRCVRPSRSGRVRIRMSLRMARPGPLQIRIDRAVGASVPRSCPSAKPQHRFSGRFRSVGTMDEPSARPGATAASVARRLTLRLRLSPGLYRISVRAKLDQDRLSAPLRRYLRVLG